jgi:hypothetical protein
MIGNHVCFERGIEGSNPSLSTMFEINAYKNSFVRLKNNGKVAKDINAYSVRSERKQQNARYSCRYFLIFIDRFKIGA